MASRSVLGRIVIGTRGSALARWQADHISALLRRSHVGLLVEQKIIVTEGDRFQTGPVVQIGGKAVWVKEIEQALLAGDIDIAVHSLKDVPAALAEGLVLAALPPRADARDALVSRAGGGLDGLASGTRVGTSSLRRACQLRALRTDLVIELLRGNVDTRLRKVADGVVDAAVMAAAGLDRLGHGGAITERLAIDRMLPAIGQGALAIEARAGDREVWDLCRPLSDPAAEITVAAERALLVRLGGGCRTPLAGHATLIGVAGDGVNLRGLVGRPDGSLLLRAEMQGPAADAAGLGARVGEQLLRSGADKILADLEDSTG